MNNEEKIIAVQKMQDYINENINKSITLSSLTKSSNYSQWHSARIFKELLGKSPFEYIRLLRLTESARRLRDEKIKIVDVAFDFVFGSHEGFTRAFTKEFGLSPYSYKQNPVPIKYFIPYRLISFNFTNKSEGVKMEKKQKQIIFTQVVMRAERNAIIKRGIKATNYYEYCQEVGCEVWGILESIKEAMFEPAGFWLPDKLVKNNTSRYVQGVEVAIDYQGVIPDGFDIIELKPCKYMVFQGEPYEDKDYEDAISDIWEAIDKFNPNIYGYEWADNAPRFQLAPLGYRGYIEARAVIEINKK